MLRILAAGIIALVALVGYCGSEQTNPTTGEEQRVALTAEQEVALGLQAAPQLSREYGGLDRDVETQAMVDRLGARLVEESVAAGSPYRFEFHVLEDEETLNAFALPGGQIFMTRGLLDRLGTEARVAGVLGHEIAHVVARHGAEHLAQQQLVQGLAGATSIATYDPGNPGSAATGAVAAAVAQLVTMNFSRQDELEADELGIRILAEGGYDPAAMLEVLKVLEEAGGGLPEFFSTHPSPENREARMRELVAQHSRAGGA
jgi:predicted Zn-dependent protease